MAHNYNVTLQNLETVPIETLEETMNTLADVIDDYPMLKDSKIIVTGGDPDTEKHLDRNGANAACIGDVLLFRKNVTLS